MTNELMTGFIDNPGPNPLSAITIDPNNQEAIALQRQVTMGN